MTSDRISILAPSRGRPKALQAMADSAFRTASNIEILAYVDEDDPSDYEAVQDVTIVRGPRINLSDCWNRLAEKARGSILHMGSDDIRFRTPHWDQMIRQAFEVFRDRIVFVYGDDGIHDRKMGTHGFVSREWYQTVGRFTPPFFPCDYADTWLNEVAAHIGRRMYIQGMLIEHLHPIAGKASWDQTHKERLERGREANVGELYESLHDARMAEAEALQRVIDLVPA